MKLKAIDRSLVRLKDGFLSQCFKEVAVYFLYVLDEIVVPYFSNV